MSYADLMEQVVQLPINEKLNLLEVLTRSIKEQVATSNIEEIEERRRKRREAAIELREYYLNDKELTALTVLDGEDFYE
jgi:hypothetical protein